MVRRRRLRSGLDSSEHPYAFRVTGRANQGGTSQ
jgi:hypothetical protein